MMAIPPSRKSTTLACLLLALLAPKALVSEESTPAPTAPDQSGPLSIVTASLLGGVGDERITAVAVLADDTVVVGGTCSGAFTAPSVQPVGSDAPKGFLATFTAKGELRSLTFSEHAITALQSGPQDRLYIRDDSGRVSIIAASTGKTLGSFVAGKADLAPLAIDSDGSIVTLVGKQLVRFDSTGKQEWAVTPPASGDNRPRACAIEPKSGISVVVGYGMTHTGHEPWKDPYARAYDRTSKRLWTLWNNPPKEQAAGKYGGTGLMADGTGQAVCATTDGDFMITIYHDGGNAVTTKDPLDARKSLDKALFAGSFQDGPGWGMKGAINTSVCFRVDAETGTLIKGTWMCAWINNHRQANTLRMENCASDASGNTYVVGASASGLPLQTPWFSPRPDEYSGGGFLALFDRELALRQCGPWHPGSIDAVAAGNKIVVIGGHAEGMSGKKERRAILPADQMRLVNPVAQTEINGEGDAFIVILRHP
jgi:hypothetical protein